MISDFTFIQTQAALQQACQHLSSQTELAFDLEFDDNRFTYGRTLCLIQVASRTACFIIDPMECGPLDCLWQIIDDERILKVFHSATQDIYLLKAQNCTPRNLADTETAARLLNYERCSFAPILQLKLGVSLDKDQQTSNWTKRPLSHNQLEYAAKDVLYLLELKDMLVAELAQTNRLPWFAEECMLMEKLQASKNLTPHLKLKDAGRLSPYHQHVLKAIYAWRDQLGKNYNQPGPRIISNAVAVELAAYPVRDIEKWRRQDGVFGPLRNQGFLTELLDVIEEAEEEAADLQMGKKPVMQPRPPRVFNHQQMTYCTNALTLIRQELINRFGPYTTELMITGTIIKRACWGPRVQIKKQYAFNEIVNAADFLGFDIHPYLASPNETVTAEEAEEPDL